MSRSNESLRICLATPYLAPYFPSGGVAWYNRWLAEGLSKRGHSVEVVGVDLHDRDSIREDFGTVTSLALEKSIVPLPRSLRAALAVAKFLRARKADFDVFETSNWPGYGAFRPAKMGASVVRLITSAENTNESPFHHTAPTKLLEFLTVRRSDLTIASTDYIRDSLSSLYWLNLDAAVRVPFGLPDLEPSLKTVSPDAMVTMLSIARAELRKGSDVFIHALLWLSRGATPFEMTIVGSQYDAFASSNGLGDEWHEVRTRFGSRLRIVDSITDDEKNALLEEADYLVMTSRSESFGLPIIEAMRAGTACISSSGGGLREVAGACTANIVYDDPESVSALTCALETALSEGKPAARVRGACARSTFLASFSEDVFLDGTIAAYRAALER